ncbi:MAG: tRNA (guanine(46)-N(7))-methyltransferase TrmB [Burkholderiales bacterium]
MTDQPSRLVLSAQGGIHPKLAECVARHLAHPYLKPYAAHTLRAFAEISPLVGQSDRPLVFDSCCGVGESTAWLAKAHPEALVIGIDKSIHRLDKHERGYRPGNADNYRLVRADLEDFWRLAVAAGWTLSHHYLLYPNPWPKPGHLQRRWHASPVFPAVLRLGGRLEVRSNWRLYVEEFAAALGVAGIPSAVEPWTAETPVSPFERKYRDSGQALWRCVADLEKR